MTGEIKEILLSLRDEKNAKFLAKLIPSIDPETILGVKTPILRKLAKPTFIHNKAPQKARESRRVAPEIKNYLQTLK